MEYKFDHPDWFSNSVHLFERFLLPLKHKPLKCLEIGTMEGRSATWLLDCLDSATLDCIDPCTESWNYWDTMMHNLDPHVSSNRCKILQGYSEQVLPRLIDQGLSYDFIYIDGAHNTLQVIRDIVMSCMLLKNGGIMAMDDYLWKSQDNPSSYDTPKLAIDGFLSTHRSVIEVMHKDYQVWVQKIEDF